jgi:hypothetical protein
MTMKGFTGKIQKKKKLAEFTLDLLLSFYRNRYSGGVYNHPLIDLPGASSLMICQSR